MTTETMGKKINAKQKEIAKYQAKFVTAWYEKKYKVLEYEYRGHKYTVNTGLYTSLAAQHHTEQASIDALIEREEQRNKEFRYEDTAEYGFNLFWDYVEG